jgi:SAM-dependent methyltransferase
MIKEIDWLELWRELVTRKLHPKTESLVERYKAHGQKPKERPDKLLDFVLKEIDAQDTAIDIGPGTGRWTIPLAQKIRSVTAVEPTSGMAEMLKENLDNAGLRNVEVLSQTWENATPSMHDIVVCAHGMYASTDLAGFVHKIERFSRKRCYLAIRLPPADGILSELSLKIYGCRHDSPDGVIVYNALYAMGIHTNVLVENSIVNWVNETVEDAFIRAKRHLRLDTSETAYDDLIYSTLHRQLTFSDGVYAWPDGMRSALLWWSPGH